MKLALDEVEDRFDVEVGKTYQGRITRVVDFGAFVRVLPGKKGFCISQIAHERVEKVSNFLSEGQEIEVKVLGLDNRVVLIIRKSFWNHSQFKVYE